jgi:hypothetical protein
VIGALTNTNHQSLIHRSTSQLYVEVIDMAGPWLTKA